MTQQPPHLTGDWYPGDDGKWYRWPETVPQDAPPQFGVPVEPLMGETTNGLTERQLLYAVYQEIRSFRRVWWQSWSSRSHLG